MHLFLKVRGMILVSFGFFSYNRCGYKKQKEMRKKKSMDNKTSLTNKKLRYGLLDTLRGFTLISMILYHSVWDLVYLYGIKWEWYYGTGAYIWQQSICWTFIFLSGFCWSLGKQPLKRGSIVFAGGLVITLVTCFFMPENKVVFGVLTLIGSCMLLMIPLHRLFKGVLSKRAGAGTGLCVSLVLFVLARNCNGGYLGFEGWRIGRLPEGWYQNLVSAYLGFPAPDFYSTDYFSVFPWFFLFAGGYFCYHLLNRDKGLPGVFTYEWAPVSRVGRYSLPIYMLHQPVLYVLLSVLL